MYAFLLILEFYDIGDKADLIYFIKSGKLKMEASYDIENIHWVPVDSKRWEVLSHTKRILTQIKIIGTSETFGFEEIALNSTKRITRVTSIEKCVLYYIYRDKFN
jgi:CRP-like cAMP-binding protein